MFTYRLRLTEETTERGSADFAIDAGSAEEAAAVLLAAYHRARNTRTNVVELADGQRQFVQRDTLVSVRAFCALLDGAGNESREIRPVGAILSLLGSGHK
jgi:hypothetical protein